MALIERIIPDFEHTDERGTLTQLIRRGYSQVNVVTSKGGISRGGHYHKYNTEAYYIIKGKCRVTAYVGDKRESTEFSAGNFFRIGPYVTHDFDYIEDTILVAMYSLGVEADDGEMDIYTPENVVIEKIMLINNNIAERNEEQG